VADKLLELITKTLPDGLTASRQGPEALRKQADAMFQAPEPKLEEEDYEDRPDFFYRTPGSTPAS
jgi:hypothetical protein